jgi:MFS family permease
MNTPSHARPAPAVADRKALLGDRSLRWLMSGALISNLGDQFTLIALPWAVLQMTRDPLILGVVLAMVGVPRALFILFGGAIVDRHSPQRVLLWSKVANVVLLVLLAAGVGSATLTLPALCGLALGLGVASAFGIPAATSMLPAVVAPSQLAAANGMMMGLRQLTLFVGPLLAGLLITLGGGGAAAAGVASPGLAWAFALDAASFMLSAWTLSQVRSRVLPSPGRQAVLAAVADGLRSFWADRDLRAFLGYGAVVSLFIAGPVQIALPVLASSTPGLGAAAFGTMLGAHGAGTLLGMAWAGMRPSWRIGGLGLTILTMDGVVGLLFMPMGHVTAIWQGAGLLLLVGALGGFIQVLVFTWLQQRVAPAMMGRAMSLFMFIFVGLAPLSAAATGALLRWVALPDLFAGAGGLLVLIVLLAFAGSRMRRLGEVPSVPAT